MDEIAIQSRECQQSTSSQARVRPGKQHSPFSVGRHRWKVANYQRQLPSRFGQPPWTRGPLLPAAGGPDNGPSTNCVAAGKCEVDPTSSGAGPRSGAGGACCVPIRVARRSRDHRCRRVAAEALKGSRIFISRSSFPPVTKDEYYWVDLIGLNVVNRESVSLGVVKELLSTGPQTVLVLEYQLDGKIFERMIPFVSVFVDEVDIAAKCIRVDWQTDY